MSVNVFEQQLQSVLIEFEGLKAKSRTQDLSDVSKSDRQAVITRAIAAVHRVAGSRSSYALEADRLLKSLPRLHEHTTSIIGVVKALLDDVKAGYTKTLVEIVHGDIFGDFLEMANHLSDAAYKDAAAVIAGSTLEAHIRSLCQKSGLPIEIQKPNGDVVPKKAETMNSDLAAANVLSKLDQKNVTAWLDLRNRAAHGKYVEYTQDQVSIMISGIRDFITRNPA